jgi:hypothetical protein
MNMEDGRMFVCLFVSTCFNKRQLGVYKFVEGDEVGVEEIIKGVEGLET